MQATIENNNSKRKYTDKDWSTLSSEQCCICWENVLNDTTVILPCCGGTFHLACIHSAISDKCPLCRAPVIPRRQDDISYRNGVFNEIVGLLTAALIAQNPMANQNLPNTTDSDTESDVSSITVVEVIDLTGDDSADIIDVVFACDDATVIN